MHSKDFKYLMPKNDYEEILADIHNKTNNIEKKNT